MILFFTKAERQPPVKISLSSQDGLTCAEESYDNHKIEINFDPPLLL